MQQQQQHTSTSTSRTKRTVVCLGDSHTRGRLGASWINLLSQRLPKLQFINAGRDGEPSERILGRLPGLLRAHPDPAAVLVLSGSNDCIGQETEGLQSYYRWCFWLAQSLSQQAALSNADRMLQMLREQAPNAKVGHGQGSAQPHCSAHSNPMLAVVLSPLLRLHARTQQQLPQPPLTRHLPQCTLTHTGHRHQLAHFS
jgi:lysophospholipase L1-like esterase